uniref:Uncharacterized protein n=1 Tax=Anguilla anguilla TaxID=7936 RepID=A0A0E9SLX0_ANGAN
MNRSVIHNFENKLDALLLALE